MKAEVIRQDVEIARAKHAEVVKDRTVAATRLWLNLWLTQREARIASRMRRWLGQLEATIRTRVESGKAASSQLLRVQVELGRIDDRVQALARRQSGLTEGLAAALSLSDGMTPGAPLLTDGVPSSPEGSEAIRAQARRFRPERALIRARAARTDAAIALMERTMTPLPTAGTSWFRGLRPVDEAGDGRAFGELPMTGKLLPFARVEVYIAEMRAMRRAIEGDLAADDRDTDRRLAVARAALVSSNETFAVHERKLIARARSAWDDTLAAYESDRVEFAELMTTVRSWLDLELARDRARHGAWMAALDIEGATGIRKYR